MSRFLKGAVANCRDTRYRPVVLDQGLAQISETSKSPRSPDLAPLGVYETGGRRVDLQEALLRLGGFSFGLLCSRLSIDKYSGEGETFSEEATS